MVNPWQKGKSFVFFQPAADWMNSLARHGPLLALGKGPHDFIKCMRANRI